jgi:hypothetical protein
MAARLTVALLLTVATAAYATRAEAQRAGPWGALRVTVEDPSGAVIPGAMVEVLEDEQAVDPLASAPTGSDGVATFSALAPGRYIVLAWFEGFEPATLTDVAIRAGQLRRETVVLKIASVAEQVDVARDPGETATDPRGDAFTTVLTERDIADLPEDPDEMQAALEQYAGPGAVLRVDGFRGGSLPPKSQIREIRFRRNMFSADTHEAGFVRVDILTKPGMDAWRVNMNVGLRDDALNARNAMAPRKVDEQQRRGGMEIDGPIWKGRTSMSLEIDGTAAFDTQTILAAGPDGEVTGALRRPTDRAGATVRVDHALTRTHVLRGEYQHRGSDAERLGVGEIDLLERAYARTTTDRRVRLSANGPFGKRLFNEVRLQTNWRETDTVPFSERPTVRVSGAFNAGGAGVEGVRTQREFELADDLDVSAGRHAVRLGVLFEGFSVESTSMRNANGTFTFPSLADYDAARPSTYTVREGNPFVSYDVWQLAWYAQNDFRARRNLMISLGVRHEWQTQLDDTWNFAPRLGFAWSPSANGRTSLRGGGGLFYDWYDAETYEQTLQLDGDRVVETVVRDPGFPDPYAGGSASVQPPAGVRQEPGMDMPMLRQLSLSIERSLGSRARLNASYAWRDGIAQLRAAASNLPGADGQRALPQYGNITVVDSTGRRRGQLFTVGGNWRLDWHSAFVAANYTLAQVHDDGDGPLSLPADSITPDEWGPARDDVRHRLGLFSNVDLFWNLRLGVNLRAESAPPYNVTTGSDDNQDTIFTDRPAGVGRNSARGDGFADLNVRIGWRVGFGERRRGGPPGGGGPQVVAVPVGGPGPGGGGGDRQLRGGPGSGDDSRVSLEVYAQAFNLLNRTHLMNYVGVVSSPLFGQPNAARPPRRIDVGVRMRF